MEWGRALVSWVGAWRSPSPPPPDYGFVGTYVVSALPADVVASLAPETWKLVGVVLLMYSLVAIQVASFFAFFAAKDAVQWALARRKAWWAGAKCAKPAEKVKTMVVLGSGGHTAEMLRVVNLLDLDSYCPRVYVVSDTDKMSAERALRFERGSGVAAERLPRFLAIPRSREVGQSYFTSIFSTLRSLISSVAAVFAERPTFLLCNGKVLPLPLVLLLVFSSH